VNILIVEDEFVSIKYLEEMILEVDFIEIENIYKARDGKTAYEIVEQNEVDLVFMDINIQGSVDGIECARDIYALDKSIPIVFTTAYKDSQTILEASQANMISYLIKPFNTSDVKVALSIAIKEISKTTDNLQLNKNTNEVKIGPYLYKPLEKVIYKDSDLVKLSTKEMEFFYKLYTNKNSFVSVESLCEYLWCEDKKDQSRSIRELLYRLRKKLPELSIENMPNIGYSLKV
jgi:DNA-binding response OmpR family regulator